MSDPTPPGIPPVPPESQYTAPPAVPVIPSSIPQVPVSYGGTDGALTENDKTMGMAAHLAALAGLLIPFGNIIGPLVVWLTQKDKSAYLDYHGKESLNFQITVSIAGFVAFLSIFLLIGILLLPAVGIYAVVMVIIATIKAKEGVRYRYPYTLRLVK
jgi:uncharacterized protein